MFLVIGIILAAIIGGPVLINRGMGTRASSHGVVKGERWHYLILGHLSLWSGIVAAIVLAALWPSMYFTSLADVNNMRAFHDSRTTIVSAIERARDVEIEGAGSVDSLVDLTYQQQSRSYTDLVADCRDRVADYNRTHRRTKALNEVPFFGQMRVGIPDDLQPITGDFCTGHETD